jgi:hypothetical protein
MMEGRERVGRVWLQKMRKGKERRESWKDGRKGKSWERLVAENEKREREKGKL